MPEMSARSQRVADQVRREIANLIQMEVSDPRVGMISVTSVEVSRDFAYAKVYVTVLNSMTDDAELNASTLTEPGKLDRLEIEENLKVLNKASGYLRSMLAKRLTIRTVPKLKFFYDGSVAKGHRLSNLIDDALAADKEQHT
jgi:ribosome-binding factor A